MRRRKRRIMTMTTMMLPMAMTMEPQVIAA